MTFSDRVISITQDTILPKTFDNILSDSFCTYRFIGNGKKWSGTSLKRPVKLVKSTLGGSFSGLDQHSTSTVEARRTMEFFLKAYEMPVSIPGLDLLVNSGDVAVLDLMKTEMDSAAMDALDDIAEIFYGDGTGNASKDFEGFDNLVDDGSTATTIGGLSRSTWPSLAGTRTAWGTTLSLAKLATMYYAVSGGSAVSQKPTLILSDEVRQGLYEQLLTPTVRANYEANGMPVVTRKSRGAIAGGELKAVGGFTSYIYKGVPWVADEKSDSAVRMLNENYLDWYGMKDPDMTQVNLGDTHEGTYSDAPSNNTGLQFSGMMKPINQYGKVGHLYLFGNFVTYQPRRHGVGTGATGI